MDSNDLTVVIVTFKSEDKIHSCLNSIPRNIRTIIVENSSDENFKKKVEDKYSNVKCILSGANKGYAVANNIGLKLVQTRFALVLNPDATLGKDVVDSFFSIVKKNNDFWLLGPSSYQQVENLPETKEFKEVNNLKGFAIFLNMEKFENIFFDENFFLYFEEIDLCTRVKKKGGKIYLNKNISIKHEGAGSVNKVNVLELEKNRNWHWMWSTFYYHKKYRGFVSAFIIILPKLFSAISKLIYYQLILNKDKKNIYFCRMSGIINSILGKKSWYRPSLD